MSAHSKNLLLILLAIFLLRFPPLYFVGVQNIFFTTHFLSMLIIGFLTVDIFYKSYRDKKTLLNVNIENILILLFFTAQSLSIFSAVNISIFIQRYSKILMGLVVYIIINLIDIKPYSKLITKILLVGTIFTIFIQIILFFIPNLYFLLAQYFIYGNVFNITKANYSAGKLFDDSYLEIAIPILIYYLLKEKNIFKIFIILSLVCVMGFLAFVSNFRYRILAYLFSIFLSIIILKIKDKGIINKIFIIVLLMLLIFKSINPFIRQLVKYTTIDRLTDKEEYEDPSSIYWRLRMFDKSVELANSSVLGVGLGNMSEHLSKKDLFSVGSGKLTRLAALESGPHNIFFQFLAETGYPGIITFVFLLGFYLKKDLLIVKKGLNIEKKTLISMFWTLIFIAQFFPAINLTFYVLFFTLRAII